MINGALWSIREAGEQAVQSIDRRGEKTWPRKKSLLPTKKG